jgi:hypothetical protein
VMTFAPPACPSPPPAKIIATLQVMLGYRIPVDLTAFNAAATGIRGRRACMRFAGGTSTSTAAKSGSKPASIPRATRTFRRRRPGLGASGCKTIAKHPWVVKMRREDALCQPRRLLSG